MRIARSAAAAALIAAGLTGCSTSTSQCADWISLPTPQQRFDQATVVVVADVTDTERTVDLGGLYRVRTAAVDRVLKGTAGDELDVVATSDQCTTDGRAVEYVGGDPLAKGGQLVLYLTKTSDDGVWRLVVPGAVDAATPLPTFTQTP